MLLPISLLLSLSAIITTSLAQQQTTQDYQVKCLRFAPMVAGNKSFTPDAVTGLSSALENNTFIPKLPSGGITLKAGYSSKVGWEGSGGYQICVQNFWFFKTLTVPLDSLSQAVAAIGEQCCDDAASEGRSKVAGVGGRPGKCQDARAIVKATDGSEIKIAAQDYGDNCCGMWSCS